MRTVFVHPNMPLSRLTSWRARKKHSPVCFIERAFCGHVMVVVAATRSFRAIFQAQREPCNPERAVCALFLEHGELWDEHLVDDVHDAVVGDHVRLKHMPSIDLDAFSHRGGYRV